MLGRLFAPSRVFQWDGRGVHQRMQLWTVLHRADLHASSDPEMGTGGLLGEELLRAARFSSPVAGPNALNGVSAPR